MFIFINAFVIGFLLHLNQFGCIDLCDVIFVLRFCYWVSALSMMIYLLRFIINLKKSAAYCLGCGLVIIRSGRDNVSKVQL